MPVARYERFVYQQSMDVGRRVDAALTLTQGHERYGGSSVALGEFFYVRVFCDSIEVVLGRNRIRAYDMYRKRSSRGSFRGSLGSCTSS